MELGVGVTFLSMFCFYSGRLPDLGCLVRIRLLVSPLLPHMVNHGCSVCMESNESSLSRLPYDSGCSSPTVLNLWHMKSGANVLSIQYLNLPQPVHCWMNRENFSVTAARFKPDTTVDKDSIMPQFLVPKFLYVWKKWGGWRRRLWIGTSTFNSSIKSLQAIYKLQSQCPCT